MAAIKGDMEQQGFYLAGPDAKLYQRQTSVVRTNCMGIFTLIEIAWIGPMLCRV
jgi:hypothetical protein